MELDQAVLNLLGLCADQATVGSAGGGGCSSASTWKIVARLEDGTEALYFMKTGSGPEAEVMFAGEHASLSALSSTVPFLCPRSFGHGAFLLQPATFFLVTEFLHLSSRSAPKAKGAPSLAAKLAKLHTTPPPIPDGCDAPMFGFPVTTCCGDTPQENGYKESWAEFYAENRLRFILGRAVKRNGKDKELYDLVEKTASSVVPRLLGDDRLNNGNGIAPVVVHGDLWSGNASVGVIGNPDGEAQDVVFDSSACYAHSEYELGIMSMFGGFGGAFLTEYHSLCPKSEPVDEYNDRVKLYELYHHLNHFAMFGGSYRSGAVCIMRNLVSKYGGND